MMTLMMWITWCEGMRTSYEIEMYHDNIGNRLIDNLNIDEAMIVLRAILAN